MWKLVNEIDGSSSGAELRRKLGQAPWQMLSGNKYCYQIDKLTATQSKVDVLVEPWANSGASDFSGYDVHFTPILCRAVLWGLRSREESVYISGDQFWGLRVVVCDTQPTSRRHC
jgi:hypothetical protein